MSQGQNRTTERREGDAIGAEWLSICKVEYHKEKSFPKFFETNDRIRFKKSVFHPAFASHTFADHRRTISPRPAPAGRGWREAAGEGFVFEW